MTRQELDFRPFDCDNHYYEALDAFTRHVPDGWKDRCVQWCDIGGRKHHLVGGKLSRAVVNPTWDPIAKPGALRDYFRGNPDGRNPLEMLAERESLPAEYMNRDARVSRLEEQGLESVWLFPTLGVLYEELLKHDVEAVKVLFKAFNQWLDEDWGLNYRDKIYAAPYISLCDVDFACEQLEWALERDARVVVMRPAAAFTELGPVSPADEMFDPFWARLNEAGITMVIHAGDSGYSSNGYAEDNFASKFGGSAAKYKPSIKAFAIERAAYDFLLTLSFERLYDRFPKLRIASVENGSGFLEDLFRKLGQTAKKSPGWFSEDPGEVFKEHVWINPFWEDDSYEVIDIMGAQRVIFGSDWPHIEGMPQPLDYIDEISDLDAASARLVLRDNTTELTSPNS
jgi:predicted TIM-barrel fold metal-dependent hydrolase